MVRNLPTGVSWPVPGVVVVDLGALATPPSGWWPAELDRVLADLATDREVRAVVLESGPSEVFTGAAEQEDAARAYLATTHALETLRALVVPVIAALDGPIEGVGLVLAAAADLRVAGPRAQLRAALDPALLEFGDLGLAWLLTHLVGPGRAAELVLTAGVLGASDSLSAGLVDRVEADPAAAAVKLALEIAALDPAAVSLSKRALRASAECTSFAVAAELESRGQALLAGTGRPSEIVTARRAKR